MQWQCRPCHSLRMLKHQIPVIFLNERNYPKKGDVPHVVTTRWLPVSEFHHKINHLKLFINNNSSSKTFVRSGNLLLHVTSSGEGWIIIFLYTYLASVRGQQETLHADEYCHPALNAFCYLVIFLLHPPMPTLILHIISEKCFLFEMSWARFKKRNRNAVSNIRSSSLKNQFGAVIEWLQRKFSNFSIQKKVGSAKHHVRRASALHPSHT